MNKFKKKQVEPTEKQKRAYNDIVVNGSNKKKAMITAGYSKNTAKAPTKMTNTRGWKELIEQHLPDSKLSKLHNSFLNKKDKKQPHSDALRALDIAYRLKNKYPAEKKEITGEIGIYNWGGYEEEQPKTEEIEKK